MSFIGARFLVLAALVAGLGLLTAGCGGAGQGPSVASLGTTSTSTSTGSGSTTGSGGLGGSSPQASSGGGSGGTMSMAGGSVAQMTKFAACMRKNGEPSFPDPNAQGQISVNIDPSSAQFQKSQQACRKLLPSGGTPSPAQQAKARRLTLAFSACMRSHGEQNFPDPQFGTGGRVSLKIAVGSGIDPRSPQFQAAQNACQKNLPGKLGAVGVKTPAGGTSSG
jgi:hypothetical protein